MSRTPNASIQQLLPQAAGFHRQGKLAEAEAIYRQILTQNPRHPDALHLLGLVAHQSGQQALAIDLIQQAISLNATMASYHHNLGLSLAAAERHAEAIAAFRKALALSPNLWQTHYNLARSYRVTGALDEAIAEYRRAICVPSPALEAQFELAAALQMRGRPEEAADIYRALLAKAPQLAEAHSNLGKIYKDAADFDAAIAEYRQALALRANLPEARNNLGNALREIGQMDEAVVEFQAAIDRVPAYHVAHSNFIYASYFQPRVDAREIARRQEQWRLHCAEPLKAEIKPLDVDRSPSRRLRIGYVSPDFRDHVVGRNIRPLLMHHDAERFEIFCYSGVIRPDAMTQHFQTLAHHWRDVATWSDAQLAEQIRQDQIDILIDLTLHLEGNRLLTFARKPAPVQLCFAGYPGGTGLDVMDYHLSDSHLDPPGATEQFYREKTLRLTSFWCFDPADEILGQSPPVSPLPALSGATFTFGCLNNFCKASEQTLDAWSQILHQMSQSRLVLLCPKGSARQRVQKVFTQAGITPDRIEFISRLPRLQYLALHQRIDLMLDTFPYNGHSTTLDALWMGVPTVTLAAGDSMPAVGRGGKSILSNLGLPELIAETPEAFVKAALQCAGDLQHLAQLRNMLRDRMRGSVLMNARQFSREIEAAYLSTKK